MREKDQWAPVAQKRRTSSPINATNNDYEKIIREAMAKINNTDRVNAELVAHFSFLMNVNLMLRISLLAISTAKRCS